MSPHYSSAGWIRNAIAEADARRGASGKAVTEIPVTQPQQERRDQQVDNLARELTRIGAELRKAQAEVAQLRGVAIEARSKLVDCLLPPPGMEPADPVDRMQQAYRMLSDVDSASPLHPLTFCSNCGDSFGPGKGGFSHCDQHAGKRRVYAVSAADEARLRGIWDARHDDGPDSDMAFLLRLLSPAVFGWRAK